MSDIISSLNKAASELKTLSEDIMSMANKKKIDSTSDSKDSKDSKDISTKSLRPTIKMYGSKEEAEKSKKNPEMDFIITQIKKIFG